MIEKNKIYKAKNRLELEKYIIENIKDKSFEILSLEMTKKFNEIFSPEEIEEYYDEIIAQGKAIVGQIADAAKDVATVDFDFDADLTNVIARFSYDVISKEFEIIYDRIKTLYNLSKQDPDNPSYDKRIVSYLERANQLRSFVLKDAFNELKRTLILDIGKRIIISAISTFIPYIPEDKKDEAKNKFMKSIENLINQQFQEPDEIKNIREQYKD